jgi:hypothetical protein
MRGFALATLTACAVALSMERNAHALGPFDVEVAARGGFATSPLSGTNAGNPLGFGVGGRAGIVLDETFYLGGSILYYFTGNENELSTSVAGSSLASTTQSVSTRVLMYGAEMGYGIDLTDFLTLRPQVGFGDATFSQSGAGASTTTWYLEPGVAGLLPLGKLLVGADVDMLLLSVTQPEVAFLFDAQVGVKF